MSQDHYEAGFEYGYAKGKREQSDRITALEAELAEARRDAARYRWLRKHYGLHSLRQAQSNLLALLKENPVAYTGAGMALDVAIDAAMTSEPKNG